MIARDRMGRRYLEVLPFDDGLMKTALAAQPDRAYCCVACGGQLVPGTDRYFQRRDPTDSVLTYELLCGPCGDQALAPLANG